MKILFSADWHIKLGQKHIPKDFQKNRYHLLVQEINRIATEHNCELHINGGDILDSFTPSAEEIQLYYSLMSELTTPSIIYSGNHEMTTKTKTVLSTLAEETQRCNPIVTIQASSRSYDFDIISYEEIHSKWEAPKGKLLFTHVRGVIPPHVTAEIDLDKLDVYDLVVTGDLHSHTCCQETPKGTPMIYPGSPLAKTFTRKRMKGAYGVLIVDTDTLETEWIDLGALPQLIRKTIKAGEPMPADEYDRVIYEVEGDLDELKLVEDSELLDKRIHQNVGTEATLNLTAKMKVSEELEVYLGDIKDLNADKIAEALTIFKELIDEDNYI